MNILAELLATKKHIDPDNLEPVEVVANAVQLRNAAARVATVRRMRP